MWYQNKVELLKETIYEIVTGEDKKGFGIAVAEIIKSEPHYHLKTVETYTLLSGRLAVSLNDCSFLLDKPGTSIKIPASLVHWAQSLDPKNPARISVVTVPAWTPEDHILV